MDDPMRKRKLLPIEPKYAVDAETGQIVNRQTVKEIPDDEPVMLFRAQDLLLPNMLANYFLSIPVDDGNNANRVHRLAVAKRLDEICDWQAKNPHRVKMPDTTIDRNWDERS